MSNYTWTYVVPVKPPHGPPLPIQVVANSIDQAVRMALAQVSGGTTCGPITKLN